MKSKTIRLLAVAAVAVPLCLLCSCKGEQKGSGGNIMVNIGPTMTLDSQDTIIVDQLSTEYIEHLKNKEFDAALAMLYYLDPDSAVVPLPRNLAIRQMQIFHMFPVLDYKFESIRFRTESDCQVKFIITFDEPAEGETVNKYTTSMYLQPVRREGQWYLTVRDSSSPAGSVSEIEN